MGAEPASEAASQGGYSTIQLNLDTHQLQLVKVAQESYQGAIAAVSPSFTCEICIEPSSSDQRFRNQEKCSHPFCANCIKNYLRVRIEDEEETEIPCPGLNCPHMLDPVSCQPILSKAMFVTWCDRLCERGIEAFDRSRCPNGDCFGPILNECGSREGLLKKMGCPKCQKPFCFRCEIAWELNHRCDDRAMDALFQRFMITKRWRRCPACGYSVERVAGCRNMNCRCGANFCYACGRRTSHLACRGGIREDALIWLVLVLVGGAAAAAIVYVSVFEKRPRYSP